MHTAVCIKFFLDKTKLFYIVFFSFPTLVLNMQRETFLILCVLHAHAYTPFLSFVPILCGVNSLYDYNTGILCFFQKSARQTRIHAIHTHTHTHIHINVVTIRKVNQQRQHTPSSFKVAPHTHTVSSYY